MDVKSDKTFEEVVERLVALFRPQPHPADSGPHSHASSADAAEPTPPGSAHRSASEDDAQS